MTLKTTMIALVLALAPALAAAECSWGKQEQITMSCADGTQYDTDTQSCVPVSTS